MFSLILSLPRFISNSPYFLPYSSYDASLENLVSDQLTIPQLIFFLIPITCLFDIVLTLQGKVIFSVALYRLQSSSLSDWATCK